MPQAATTTPQAATWLKNDTSTDILLFICTDKPKDVSQSAGWLRETHAPMAIGWLQPTLGCPFLRQYLRKENRRLQPTDGENMVRTSSGRNRQTDKQMYQYMYHP